MHGRMIFYCKKIIYANGCKTKRASNGSSLNIQLRETDKNICYNTLYCQTGHKTIYRRARLAKALKCSRHSLCHTKEYNCLLYTSDAADEEDSVDLGGRRFIKKKK